MREIVSHSATSLLIFGVAALLLAFGGPGNIDRLILRLIIELPLLMIAAAVATFLIHVIAGLIGNSVLRTTAIAAVLAALLGWSVAEPPGFGELGYHWLLRPAFAMALAWPWLAGAGLQVLISRSS